jgi:hypothetical protein
MLVMDPLRPGRRPPPVLDMTPDGAFRDPPAAQAAASWLDRSLMRVGGAAVLVAALTGALAMVAVALLLVSFLLPIALLAGLVGFGSLWWRVRRARRQGGAAGPIRFVFVRR